MNIIFLNFFIGASLGSHALVVLERNDAKDFLYGFSRCDSCNFPLTIFDEIPIFAYISKKGRCTFCHSSIPFTCLSAEIAGGILFLFSDFLSISGIQTAIFTYFIFLIALFDLRDQEFEISLLFIPILIALFSPIAAFHNFSKLYWIIFIIFLALFLIMNFFKKMGFGDTLLFLILYLFIGYSTVNMLLYASLAFIFCSFLTKNNQPTAFVPFIVLGLAFSNFFR